MAETTGFICSAKGNRVVISNATPDGKKAVRVGAPNTKIVKAVLTDAIKAAKENGHIKVFKGKKEAETFLNPKSKKAAKKAGSTKKAETSQDGGDGEGGNDEGGGNDQDGGDDDKTGDAS